MNISWPNTAKALHDFARILVCGKCGLKPESPIRFTNCGHFFCYNCAKMATKCFICDIPVQPKEMNQDHMVSNLIRNCDIIAEVIEKKDLWNNNIDCLNTSMDTTISKTICIPKNTNIPKNLNKPNSKGETYLHAACLKQNIERVKVLIVAGADPNTKDHAGWTPLQEMVSYGHIELCELLLKGGASPNIPGNESRRPLHDAAISNRIEEAKLLLRYHADVDVYDKFGKSPLDYCKSDEMQEILMGSHTSSYSSEKTDLNQTLDRSFAIGKEKLVVLASNLKPENQRALSLVAAQHKFKVLSTNRSSVTHVIVETYGQSITKLTVDVLFAIIRGNWLLSSECKRKQ